MDEQLNDEEIARAVSRRIRLEKMRQSKQMQMMRRRNMLKAAPFAAGVLVIVVLVFGGIKIFHRASTEKQDSGENIKSNSMMENQEQTAGQSFAASQGFINGEAEGREENEEEGDAAETNTGTVISNQASESKSYQADFTANTVQLGEYLTAQQEFYSDYAILVDLNEERVIAEKYGNTRINPASMTKILTVLVAAEHIKAEDLDDQFTMTLEITDYGYIHDCSSAGFVKEEQVSVRDLFYGTVLPSGADAAVGLATYVAGSQEAFVELMNEKLRELGLSDTAHFTNCVGVYDEEHYCTAYDIAMILEAAIDNELCREVLKAHTYTTSITEQHPEGIIISNWFLRRIEDREGGEGVVCAKTGYVAQSGSCAASYAVDHDGKGYVCVTAGANSQWRCIYDHAGLYKKYLP